MIAFLIFTVIFLLIASVPVVIFIKAKQADPIKINYNFSEVSRNGFRIKLPSAQIINPKLIAKQGIVDNSYIFWKDVEKIYFTNDKDSLTVKLKDKKQFSLSKYNLVFYKFLKLSPNLSPFDKNYADTIFKNVKDCDICGMVSVHQGICLNCLELSWEENVGDEPEETKEEYIKKLQLDYFALGTMDEDNKVNFFPESDPFERSAYWKPSVTEAEVLEYYKKEYEE